jgi:hypothetical protein
MYTTVPLPSICTPHTVNDGWRLRPPRWRHAVYDAEWRAAILRGGTANPPCTNGTHCRNIHCVSDTEGACVHKMIYLTGGCVCDQEGVRHVNGESRASPRHWSQALPCQIRHTCTEPSSQGKYCSCNITAVISDPGQLEFPAADFPGAHLPLPFPPLRALSSPPLLLFPTSVASRCLANSAGQLMCTVYIH